MGLKAWATIALQKSTLQPILMCRGNFNIPLPMNNACVFVGGLTDNPPQVLDTVYGYCLRNSDVSNTVCCLCELGSGGGSDLISYKILLKISVKWSSFLPHVYSSINKKQKLFSRNTQKGGGQTD